MKKIEKYLQNYNKEFQEISDIKPSKLPKFKISETENIGNFILEYFKR